jgi:hypothetical protein
MALVRQGDEIAQVFELEVRHERFILPIGNIKSID